MARKRKKQILLLPPDREVEARRKKLPIFEAHDLRSLLAEAKASQHVDGDDAAVLAALRRRNEVQMQKLLRALGVDPSRPDAWARGFFLLAHCHHGVGHLAWYPRRTNRNAAKWTRAQDLELLREVIMLTRDGLSQRRAIAKIAADPEKNALVSLPRTEVKVLPQGHTTRATRGCLMGTFSEAHCVDTRPVALRPVWRRS
jgi:hypothetical protein